MAKVGVTALALGVLIYLASRGLDRGWAGVLLSGVFSWFGFELTLSFVRRVGRLQTRIQPRHAILGGCLGFVAACGAGGLLLFFGQQLIYGVILGGVAALVAHRTGLPTMAQLGGLAPRPDTAGDVGIPPFLGPVAVIVGVVCLVAGVTLAGLGTVRELEAYSYATDTACTHPCGMVHGLWVQVLPDTHGDFVTRLDSTAVQIRLRFRDDVVGDRIASQSGFTLTNPPAVYKLVADRGGCNPWESRLLHNGDSTGDLTVCFAISQSQEVDTSQLILEWAVGDVTAPILLGKKASSGIGIDVNTG
jgi:hypothetical protein